MSHLEEQYTILQPLYLIKLLLIVKGAHSRRSISPLLDCELHQGSDYYIFS